MINSNSWDYTSAKCSSKNLKIVKTIFNLETACLVRKHNVKYTRKKAYWSRENSYL